MSVAHNGLESARPLLGQLLVDAGLLSASDLQTVLERQRETGLPLGRMLVDEGFVPAHSVAMALAEQHGGLLKTEYGFATGQRGTSSVVPLAPPPASPAVAAAPEEPGEAPFPLLRLSRPAEEQAHEPTLVPVEPAPTPVVVAPPEVAAHAVVAPAVVAPDPELASLRIELGAAQTQIDELNETLERRTMELEASAARVRDAETARDEIMERLTMELEASAARVREAETARDETLERRTMELEASAARVREAEEARDEALADLAGAREQVVVLETSLEEAANAPVEAPGRVYADDRHTLFVPGPGGYAAVDRTGPAPEVGAEVEMSGGERFSVVRIGPSPLPGETQPHVYLDRVGPSWAELA
jgi:hypothetical protein